MDPLLKDSTTLEPYAWLNDDAETFRTKHPARIFGKALTAARSQGAYVCSFHDSSWLDYLRLPHSLNLSTLDEIANHYWKGALVEEVGLTFLNDH